jgi:hypothetical protein
MKTLQEHRFAITSTTKATIDQLEDSEYSSEVNKKLGIRYNYSPQINLTP